MITPTSDPVPSATVGRLPRLAAVLAVGIGLVACSSGPEVAGPPTPPSETTPTTPTPTGSVTEDDTEPTTPEPTPETATEAPAWLGTRVLEPGPTGFPPPQPTPPELFPRSIVTPDRLPPPDGGEFVSTVSAVPDEVAARSTWEPACPVTLDDLRYVTVSFWGFDGRHHTGELLLNADAVEAIVEVFARLHEVRFPMEDVAIVSHGYLDAPATGDGNITTAFVCRPAVATTSWSQHAYGRAIDVNPFHNPYRRSVDAGEIVLPELSTAYLDRDLDLPGMIHEGGPVVAAFDAVGWSWGGRFRTLEDYHHFSATGR